MTSQYIEKEHIREEESIQFHENDIANYSFNDKREEAEKTSSLRDLMNNSPRHQRVSQLQELAKNSTNRWFDDKRENITSTLKIDRLANSRQEKSIGSKKEAVIQGDTLITQTPGYVSLNGFGGQGVNTSHPVGKRMRAELDVDDPVIGSSTGVNWTWMQYLRNQYPAANVVRGHLLNHDLGGFGVSQNLYPISTQANMNHSLLVEQRVKDLLNIEGVKPYANREIVHYDLDVLETNAGNPTNISFSGHYYTNSLPRIPFNIPSDLVGNNGGYGGAGANGILAHKDWAHGKRSGTEDFDSTVQGGKVQVTAPDQNQPVNYQDNVDAEYIIGAGLDALNLLNINEATQQYLHEGTWATYGVRMVQYGREDFITFEHHNELKQQALDQAKKSDEFQGLEEIPFSIIDKAIEEFKSFNQEDFEEGIDDEMDF